MKNSTKTHCTVCGKLFGMSDLTPGRFVRPLVAERIAADCPDWNADAFICLADMNHYRSLYVQNVLEQERGELTTLEKDVIESLREHDVLTQNLNVSVDDASTLGQRLADKVASFGGSWIFISIFSGVLIVWITINAVSLLGNPFDPYPFILLNLVLSCLAAIQAPIIMMSQNRQNEKDRLKADNDYRVNLKAELEIRHLHSKLDLLLTHQWQRLLEIQQVQTDLLEEMSNKR
ncbi:hypothetical protein K227x_37380 [Rubripirellula lacrimiformis]|uniref:DUF1003 domain-containing protein n=1 Tax=Rubripirellula lacrimiformis TaxID=1930273 RepID=A0A517NE45_9BACT|nr:DUF1003 domain-containing protein [Rubripirellula lacrimiformis]QDT05338.1 hypothetical protein K227x_37380 [Rubripirellula lacrimiformis]